MRRGLALIAAALVAGVAALAPSPAPGASAQRRAAALRGQIEAKQGELARARGRGRVLASDIAGLSRRLAGLQHDITEGQRRESRLQAALDRAEYELARTQVGLATERQALGRARAELAATQQTLRERLRQVYEAGPPDALGVVLRARGFAELLERGEFLARINARDAASIADARRARTAATQAAARLGALEHRRRLAATAVGARYAEVARVRAELVRRRAGFTTVRAQRQSALARVRAHGDNLEGELTALRSQEEEVRKALLEAQGYDARLAGPVRAGAGLLGWPVDGPVTSGFCERRSYEACHPGIDIAVASGTPIRAAAGGRVALQEAAGASGGYGNFTCVQHAAHLSTCYAHQSRFAVGSGARVRGGQTIGWSGCTGRCTGPHLHFEVRVDGAVVDPLGYL